MMIMILYKTAVKRTYMFGLLKLPVSIQLKVLPTGKKRGMWGFHKLQVSQNLEFLRHIGHRLKLALKNAIPALRQ